MPLIQDSQQMLVSIRASLTKSIEKYIGGMWFDDDKYCESLKVDGESNMAGLDFFWVKGYPGKVY